uniref:heavy metal translocating P-type ATPase n=1 Tax=Agathobacter sp. TaxID=2021311 RepID=UPI004055BC8A
MKFIIKHEIRGRIRIHICRKKLSYEEADTLLYFLHQQKNITFAKVYDRIADVVIKYTGNRQELLKLLCGYKKETVEVPMGVLENSGRELSNQYKEKLVMTVIFRYFRRFCLPIPIRYPLILLKAATYIWKGVRSLLKRKLEVAVLDATAIAVSLLRGEFATVGSIMFMLRIGELLEEWTHKKSVEDLARTMSLNVSKTWLKIGKQQILVSTSDIRKGDEVVVHMGSVIPFDGTVTDGEAMVNQASLTGESVPVEKTCESTVYAGSVVEEGELTICVNAVEGKSRYDKIVKMIEETEKLKTSMESRAEHLADRLVPYTFGGAILTWLLTRNASKAISVLLVDFSCALKLAMPIAVLSAIREAGLHNITVKGGKYFEAMAEANTIVFDKTGTLTKATPTVVDVISFDGREEDELLRMAACIEEHFPHSMAKAVVDAAVEKGLEHEEIHTKVEYVVAHGISTTIEGKKTIIGSRHFVFEDEKCTVPKGKEELFENISAEQSHLYLAIENELAGVICIEDPLREEAENVILALRQAGFNKVVMMTGDSKRTAAAIAKKLGIGEYYAEVLPEDKANFILEQKALGRHVVMVGDGINDSPALSASDVGVAISDGAEIAREIADITISSDDLYQIVTLKKLSDNLVGRINANYRKIVGINGALIVLGVTGVILPTTSALLHNSSTLVIGLDSMTNLL